MLVTSNKPFSRRRRTRGFTLIEVLISILVFSFGVLGAVGMQARVLQLSTQNSDRARASMLANELATQMVLAKSVTIDITAWNARVGNPAVSGLPSGVGSVAFSTPNGTNTATITVKWTVPSTQTASQFQTSVVVP
jgi:type IV pilus assembly protein PilV